jgi:prepilin-type processing-associated H-X9-DG protein
MEPQRDSSGRRYTNAILNPAAQGWGGAFREFRWDAVAHASTRPLISDSSTWALGDEPVRHRNGRNNVVFCDGHAASERPTRIKALRDDPASY